MFGRAQSDGIHRPDRLSKSELSAAHALLKTSQLIKNYPLSSKGVTSIVTGEVFTYIRQIVYL